MIFTFWQTDKLQQELAMAQSVNNDKLLPQQYDAMQALIKLLKDELAARSEKND